jgi:catechol 2,3-dioxygenase-like lactoylglutathione lyase family enzyme
MIHGARYVHTNLIARDWRALVDFYCAVFGCVVSSPERDLHGASVDAGTGVPGATVTGVHLRLPGHGPDGPTLEVFNYSQLVEGQVPEVNRPGLAHLAFAVPSVPEARLSVLAAGGAPLGEVVTMAVSGKQIAWCYVRDPEGNIIELQAWS